MERLLKVGDLARETGKSVRAIHLYEEMGLIQSIARTRSRYRLFSESTLERLSWISSLQASGLSLSQIQELTGAVRGCEAGRDAMCHLRCFYEERLDQIRGTIAALRGIEQELVDSLLYLEVCRDCDRPKPKEDCIDCRRERPVAKPALVRGVHADPEWVGFSGGSPAPENGGATPSGPDHPRSHKRTG